MLIFAIDRELLRLVIIYCLQYCALYRTQSAWNLRNFCVYIFDFCCVAKVLLPQPVRIFQTVFAAYMSQRNKRNY